MSKPFDIIIYGATGFTGQLIVRYFLTQEEASLTSPNALKWAIAGRSEEKLQQLKQTLKTKEHSVASDQVDQIPIVVANSSDHAALLAMVQKTKVVLTVAGPYAIHSKLLVQLCAANGVHYCDLTGEMIWAEQIIRQHETTAKKTGARVVNCCGFEAVPADITTFVLAEFVRSKLQKNVANVSFYWLNSLNGVSGGTCASLLGMMDEVSTKDLKRLTDPYFLTSEDYAHEKRALKSHDKTGICLKYNSDIRNWTSMFIAAAADVLVVYRTNYILKDKYGDTFTYRERFAGGGFWFQCYMTITTILLFVLGYFRLTRALLRYLAPKPGTGPSDKALQEGFLDAIALAYDDTNTLIAKAKVHGVGDPGYMLTSKMIAEVAFCLAKDEHEGGVAGGGGFLTPASAGGQALAKRLSEKKILLIQTEAVNTK